MTRARALVAAALLVGSMGACAGSGEGARDVMVVDARPAEVVSGADVGEPDSVLHDTLAPGTTAPDTAVLDTDAPDVATADGSTIDAGPADAGPSAAPAGPCDAGDRPWAARAIAAILGRKPSGVREVNLVAAWAGEVGRAQVARALTRLPGYVQRWRDFFIDELRVARGGLQRFSWCYGETTAAGQSPAFAAWVRDHKPTQPGAWVDPSMADLIDSALRLDDMSPLYLGHLFAMLMRPRPYCNNLTVAETDEVQRVDFGRRFAATYLHRNTSCTPCHNSAFSVTDNKDPKLDRFWPLPGRPELAVSGSHTMQPDDRLFAFFRRIGVAHGEASEYKFLEPPPAGPKVSATPIAPWGMREACGLFTPASAIPADTLQKQAFLAEAAKDDANVWRVEAALHGGLAKARSVGVTIDPQTGAMTAGDALAWLLSTRVVHQVWAEVMGSDLTVAYGFPRNKAQRDKLLSLTEGFLGAGYSLRETLVAIVTDPLFNLLPPASGCMQKTYGLPAIFTTWSSEEEQAAMRGNSAADGVSREDTRTLLRMAARALGWPMPAAFPSDAEADAQAGLGAFISDPKPGFRGIHFTMLLRWEQRLGACARPPAFLPSAPPPGGVTVTSCAGRCGDVAAVVGDACWCDGLCQVYGDCCADFSGVCKIDSGATDWIDDLIASVQRWDQLHPSAPATVADVAIALKDRLLTEASLADLDERALVANLFHTNAVTAAAQSVVGWKRAVRAYCGVLLKTPDFLLRGLPAASFEAKPPALRVAGQDVGGLCHRLRKLLAPQSGTVICTPDGVTF